MRVAILHDYLNQFGGAERVLQFFLEIFPEADLYSLLYDDKKTRGLFGKNIKKTSFLDLPVVRKKHRLFIPFMPFAAKKITIDDNYDLVISSSAGYAKGFGLNRDHRHGHRYRPFHISYCHSPLRYAWELEYLKNLPVSPWFISHQLLTRPIANLLKFWDKRAAGQVDFFIANSNFIAEKIKNYYNRESVVVYPPVDTDVFKFNSRAQKGDYFLMVGRLLYYKRFDLGIKTFNNLKLPLKIVGSGPETKKLKKGVSSPLMEFIPRICDEDLCDLYNGAKALIFPQVEDFGLVAAEAQACGLPVLAFNQGGALEIVEDGKTGLFFGEQSPEAIAEAVKKFENIHFDGNYISERAAKKFSKEEFKSRIKKIAEKCLK